MLERAILTLAWDFRDQPAWHAIRGCRGSVIWRKTDFFIFEISSERHSFLLGLSRWRRQDKGGVWSCLWLMGPSVLQVWYKLPAYVLLLYSMFIQHVQVQACRRNAFIFPWQGGWNEMIFKVPSNTNHSMILWSSAGRDSSPVALAWNIVVYLWDK